MATISREERAGKMLADEGARAGVSILELRYDLEDKPAPLPSILFGLQHVLIMFTAMIASPLVIGQLLNLSADLRTTSEHFPHRIRNVWSCEACGYQFEDTVYYSARELADAG